MKDTIFNRSVFLKFVIIHFSCLTDTFKSIIDVINQFDRITKQ